MLASPRTPTITSGGGPKRPGTGAVAFGALPFVPGSEVAGIVRSAPDGAAVSAGDRVAAFCMLGGFAEVAVAPEFLTFKLSDDLDFGQGAALILNYHTVLFSLKLRGQLKEGEQVLVQARRPDPTDGRSTLAGLTDAGRAKLEVSAPGHVNAVRRDAYIFLAPTRGQDISLPFEVSKRGTGRPCRSGTVVSWSIPSKCKIVACKSCTLIGSRTMLYPKSSVSPITVPGLIPPPANQSEKQRG